MNKKRITLTVIILCIILFLAGILFFVTDYNAANDFNLDKFDKNIKEITAQTKVIDANLNHNQALDVADWAKSQGLQMPDVLINFDTHSDIYLNLDVKFFGAKIYNWINAYFAQNPEAQELYWVMPKDQAQNIVMQLLFAGSDYWFLEDSVALYGNSLKKLNLLKFIFTPLTKKYYEQEFLIDTETGMMNEYVSDSDYKKAKAGFDNTNTRLRKIKVITCTEDTLPDFEGRNVFLSIDADYFSNSGFDTTLNYKNNKNEKEIDIALYSIIKTIKERNIKPEIINLTLSPQYLPKEDHKQITMFFNKVFYISQKPKALQYYKYQIDDDTLEDFYRFTRYPFLYFLEL